MGIGSDFHFAHPLPTLMQRGHRREWLCFCCSALGWAAKVFPGCQGPFWILGFGLSRWWLGCLRCLLASAESLDWQDRLLAGCISRSPSKKCPGRTSFWGRVCGEGCPYTGRTYWETPFPFPEGSDVETCRETHPLSDVSPTAFTLYLMNFFNAPNRIWHLVYLGNESRREECERGVRWPRKEAKQFFSSHILFDKRIWVNIIVLLKPKLHVRALRKNEKHGVNCSSENNRMGHGTWDFSQVF